MTLFKNSKIYSSSNILLFLIVLSSCRAAPNDTKNDTTVDKNQLKKNQIAKKNNTSKRTNKNLSSTDKITTILPKLKDLPNLKKKDRKDKKININNTNENRCSKLANKGDSKSKNKLNTFTKRKLPLHIKNTDPKTNNLNSSNLDKNDPTFIDKASDNNLISIGYEESQNIEKPIPFEGDTIQDSSFSNISNDEKDNPDKKDTTPGTSSSDDSIIVSEDDQKEGFTKNDQGHFLNQEGYLADDEGVVFNTKNSNFNKFTTIDQDIDKLFNLIIKKLHNLDKKTQSIINKKISKIYDSTDNAIIYAKLKKLYTEYFCTNFQESISHLEDHLKKLTNVDSFQGFISFLRDFSFYDKETEIKTSKNTEYVHVLRESLMVKYDKNNKVLIVDIRGTSFEKKFIKREMGINITGRFTDLKKYNLKSYYHKGFTKVILSDDLPTTISLALINFRNKFNLDKNTKVIFMGHSMGAAIATILAIIFAKNEFKTNINGKEEVLDLNPKNISVIATGVPPMMDTEARKDYNKYLGENTLFMYHKNDPVTALNRFWFTYDKKIGKHIVLNRIFSINKQKHAHKYSSIVESLKKYDQNYENFNVYDYSLEY